MMSSLLKNSLQNTIKNLGCFIASSCELLVSLFASFKAQLPKIHFLRKEKEGNALEPLVLVPILSLKAKSLLAATKRFKQESNNISLRRGLALIASGFFSRALYTLSNMTLCPIVLNLLALNFCSINDFSLDFSSNPDSLLEQEQQTAKKNRLRKPM